MFLYPVIAVAWWIPVLIVAAIAAVVAVVAYAIYRAATSNGGEDGGAADPLDGACNDAADQGNDPVEGERAKPCTPGAKKKIDSVTLISLTFLSDHALLKDYVSDWDDGGTKYPEPEWTPANSYPVSQTMDTLVKVKLKLRVGPSDAASERGTLRGEGPGGMVFEREVDLSPGDQEVELVSDRELEKKIQRLDFAIQWKITGTSAPLMPDKTANEMFVTMGAPTTPPSRPGITLKRMRQAVTVTSGAGSVDQHAVVKHVISKWGTFNLDVVYDNAWKLSDDAAGVGADCQTIVRYTDKVIKMVGCPGKVEPVLIWAKPSAPFVAIENPMGGPHLDNPAISHPTEPWEAGLIDYRGGVNNFEACLKFTDTDTGKTMYYAGGVGPKNTKDEVLRVFKTMSWCKPGPGGKWVPVQTIAAY
jgi:hypothetical protein